MYSFFKSNIFTYWKLLVPLTLLPVLFSSVNELLIGIAVPIIFIIYLKYGERFLLFMIIVSFVLLTAKISPIIRLGVQIFNYLSLTYLFLTHYGIKISHYPRIPRNVKYFIFSLLSLMLISSFNSVVPLLGFEKLITLILFFYLIYMLFALIKSNNYVNVFLLSIFICALVSSAILILEVIKFRFDLFQIYQEVFTKEAYIGKNNVGVLFSITIIFLTSLLFVEKFKNSRKYFYLLLFVISIGLIFTDSRASILCLFISVSTIIYILSKQAFKIGIVVICIMIFIIWLTPFRDDILLYLRVENIGTGREYLINATFEVIKNNFILGAGPAGTKLQLYSNLPYLLNTPPEWLISKLYDVGDINQTHNFYLFFFSDLGVAGFILSLALPVVYFTNCKKILNVLRSSQNSDYCLVVGLIGTGIFIFTRGLFEQMNIISYGHIYYDLPFWLLMSILIYYYNKHVKTF